MLAPLQLGYGMPFGEEAALYSARLYLSNLPPDSVMLKIDFNCVRHDGLLEAVASMCWKLIRMCTQAIPPCPHFILVDLS